MRYLAVLALFFPRILLGQEFSCPAGQADAMKYFVMAQESRAGQFMSGLKNPIYTHVFPNRDFSEAGYWFWLKSPSGNGFDVKSYNKDYIFMRSTELVWSDATTFKRFVHDLPIAARCVAEGKPGPEIKVRDTHYQYFADCTPYKQSQLGTAVNTLDAPALMDTGGNIGPVWTRVLHYRYNCNTDFQACADEEQFYLANGYGLWQWKHLKNGSLVNTTLINNLTPGITQVTLPCPESYKYNPPSAETSGQLSPQD